ncbi:hypothetical protein [Lentibacter sp. XHP0401]|uniref:hypothetical protein n=1 Tax=Lentibacter sp. XHP0401 TaxID=2984334 RepID=UPI0021E8AE35|nr:hypothetical protein [Lentibacter sp. XHP0401]MCV2894256.1 hypothetical protein [Lentibacter sp. XHP0401]
MRISKYIIVALSLVCSQALAEETVPTLAVELNAEVKTESGCLLSFLVGNDHEQDIEAAVFETVLFDKSGQVDRLTLFDFGALPAGRPRVRQFQVDGLACENLGQILINGASSCKIAGADSPLCGASLKLSTRTETELAG